MSHLTLLTDLYQLTMLAGYHASGKLAQQSCFDLYFRRLPFSGGFCVAAGLQPALEYVQNLNFCDRDLAYLDSLALFSKEFLDWLSTFQFRGQISAVAEGELVFPGEPLLRIEAPLAEAQLVESALLNMINFQTLVATKSARVKLAAEQGAVLEFGLRRAQGIDGALSASRAAYIGGCDATSNTLAGQRYGIPVKGTHAHSWIMSFPTELEAFATYANLYPDSCTLLVDTYDTLASGVPNAIRVGQDLLEKGHRLAGIRLDSGDLAQLSREARRMLDQSGLPFCKIVASNDLDEYKIESLKSKGACIDIWGVGTNLVTCKDEPALGGVYKLVAAGATTASMEPRIKISANPIKTTIPGIKQVYRFFDTEEKMIGDLIALQTEEAPASHSVHPSYSPLDNNRGLDLQASNVEELLKPVYSNGEIVGDVRELSSIRNRCLENISRLPQAYKSTSVPNAYPVGLSKAASQLRQTMLARNFSD